jgi:crotonobetainyl-CoA:carnitine CoA-transferase CaiB-like acyl-CoA transferase
LQRTAPDAGEHSAQVLREFGFDDDEIQTLKQQGVVT